MNKKIKGEKRGLDPDDAEPGEIKGKRSMWMGEGYIKIKEGIM